jgi:hypothetical protein
MSQGIVGRQTFGEPLTQNFYDARWDKADCKGGTAKDSKPDEPFVRLCLVVDFFESTHKRRLKSAIRTKIDFILCISKHFLLSFQLLVLYIPVEQYLHYYRPHQKSSG